MCQFDNHKNILAFVILCLNTDGFTMHMGSLLAPQLIMYMI
jgi:hypothetical protein